MKLFNILFGVSLTVISISTLITSGANLLGIALPDLAIRLFGLCNLVSLPCLIFSTLKKVRDSKIPGKNSIPEAGILPEKKED